MKKKTFLLASCLICALLVFNLSGFGSPESPSTNKDTSTSIADDKETDEGNAADNENKNVFGDWFVEEYKDDFGDSTGSTFCFTMSDGTFSNSATSESELVAGVYYDLYHPVFLFRLLEYGNTKASYLSNASISIKCKVGDYVFEDTLIGDAPNGELILSEKNKGFKQIYSYLEDGEEIRTVIYIDNSKYSFSISGNGFKSALSEQEKRKELAGISGTYKDATLTGEYAEWFVIKQVTPTSGTITSASKSGSATLDYTYDPDTHVLTVVPDDDWTYRCLYDKFIVDDIVLLPEDGGTVEGVIPDKSSFDATIKWSSAKNQATHTYEFKKDGSFIEYGTDYEGDETETKKGTYTVVDSFIIKKYSAGYIWTDYNYNGKLYSATTGVYVIDK